MRLYDHPASGNCMKARILLHHLELPYERVQVDLFSGETRTPEHFARNPDGPPFAHDRRPQNARGNLDGLGPGGGGQRERDGCHKQDYSYPHARQARLRA